MMIVIIIFWSEVFLVFLDVITVDPSCINDWIVYLIFYCLYRFLDFSFHNSSYISSIVYGGVSLYQLCCLNNLFVSFVIICKVILYSLIVVNCLMNRWINMFDCPFSSCCNFISISISFVLVYYSTNFSPCFIFNVAT